MDNNKWKPVEGCEDVNDSLRAEFCVSGPEFSHSAIRLITLFNSVCPGLPGK